MIVLTAEETDARLRYLESARQFFIQAWRDNPDLLIGADPKLIDMMRPVWEGDKLAKASISKSDGPVAQDLKVV